MYAEPEYTSDVVGVMYSGTEADIVKRGSEWTEVTSGGVTGYIKNTDVLFGEEAQKIAETIGDKEAVAKSDGLVVYSEASASSSQVAELSKGESVGAYEECDGYVMISHEGGYGYVKADGVSISYGLDSAISIEEEKKRQAEEAAAAAKKAEEEEKLRKATCESLIRNAKELKEAGKYKNALSQLAKARDLGVAEALNQIRDLEKEIKSLKEANSPIKRLTDLFGRILEE